MKNEQFHNKPFKFESEEIMQKLIETNFDKNLPDDRKKKLATIASVPGTDFTQEQITYSEFFDNDFLKFSYYNCTRSIPSVIDGLKTC